MTESMSEATSATGAETSETDSWDVSDKLEEKFAISKNQDSNEWVDLTLNLIDKLSVNSTTVQEKIKRLSAVENLVSDRKFKQPSSVKEYEIFKNAISFSVNVYNLTEEQRSVISEFVNFTLTVNSVDGDSVSVYETVKNIKKIIGHIVLLLDEGY